MPTFTAIQAPEHHAEPSELLRSFVFSANLEMQDITGDVATSTTYEACREMLLGSPETSTSLFCLIDQQHFPLGYLQLTESLKDAQDSLDVDFLLDAELQPLPDENPNDEVRTIANTLINEALKNSKQRSKRYVHTWVPSIEHPYFQWLRSTLERRGFSIALEETHGWIQVASVPAPSALAPGLNVHVWRDFNIDEAWLEAVATMLELGDADVPLGTLNHDPSPWTPERITGLKELTQRRGNRVVHTAISKGDQLLGYTAMVCYPTGDPSVAWQGLTVVAPEARSKGIGKQLKQHAFAALREQLPLVQRICSKIAGSNTAMLRLNESLGFEPQTTWVALQKELSD